ncbi:MAG: Uma2 family endonuclease [Pyrinomonadaceae bacterium]|nr:Uma2 family endonuclease [Pyrinomonadaceae bacterium]
MQATAILDVEELLADIVPGDPKVLYGVSWEDYLELTKNLLEETHIKTSFNRGILKIMVLGFRHDNKSRFIHDLIRQTSLILKIKTIPAGSMSLISNRVRKGADPDESYYIQNYDRASFKRELYDDATDTPPDLVVEIDETHKSEDKFEIYAAFGIKEFWLYDAEILRIFELSETGDYLLSKNSLALPILTATVLTEFLNRSQREDQFKVLLDFQNWLEENK